VLRRLVAPVLIVLALAAIVGGCGDDGGSDGGSATTNASNAGSGAAAGGDENGGGQATTPSDEDDADGGSSGSEEDSEDPDGDSGEEATEPLDKTEFIKQAEQICLQETEGAISGIVPYIERLKKQDPNTDQEIGELRGKAVVAVMVPSFESQIDQIRALGIPEGDEQEVEAILATMQRSADALRKDPPSANGIAKAGVELRQKFAPLDKIGREYGFKRCAYGGLR